MSALQVFTGAACHCRRGIERDNCPDCEGTGKRIDFRAIRAAKVERGILAKLPDHERRMEARRVLALIGAANAEGRPLLIDFHELRASQVDALLAEADRVRYRKPKNANGSRARYFYALLQRRAS